MLVTYNWLKDFVDFDDSPQGLCDRLTMVGLEVDSLEAIGADLDTVIVAKLEDVATHPDADRLTVCQVNNGQETVQVVCGATNHKTGDLVALAQPGSVLPGEFKIKKSKIRGQVSAGMLCSEKELGLSHESAGIMILPAGLTLGQPVFEALALKDYKIEIGLTPNRPDCLSVVGVAREVAAIYGKPLRLPSSDLKAICAEPITEQASISIEDAGGCPRYAARMIKDVVIAPSPDWLVRRLEAVGMRSINNVVDVTNYVMMELGHPLHAFDFRYLEEGRIVVKKAQEGDLFTTLDGQDRTLSGEDLMICDGRRPVALAGVMGGLNSEVQDDTSTILLEAAYFKPTSIRRTAKRHGLHTESSHRFERGADIDMIPIVLDRAAALIAELGQGEILSGIIDNYSQPLPTPVLDISVTKTCQLLDVVVDRETIAQLLGSIGLRVEVGADADDLRVTVPSFRPDIEREIDLIEEVARLYGYHRIPVTMPKGIVDAKQPPKRQQIKDLLTRFMVGAGFAEAINYSFVSADSINRLGLAADDDRLRLIPLRNPLSEDQAVMRTSLVPSLLETVARNLNYKSTDLRLFELRPVFLDLLNLPEDGCAEKLSLTAVLTGRREPEGWSQSQANIDFYDVKGIVEELLTGLSIDQVSFDPTAAQPYLHPGKSCGLMVRDGLSLGVMGELHPQVLGRFDIDQPVYLIELDVEGLIACCEDSRKFVPLSRYPNVIRDSALLVAESVSAAQVLDIARSIKQKTIEDVTLFDVYTGKGIPEGKKSMAIRVRYRDLEKTLTEEEVNRSHDKLIRTICQQLGAEIR